MGRARFAPQRVYQQASRLFETDRARQPCWYDAVGSLPPAERIVRPAIQNDIVKKRRGSRMFQPVKIAYVEDELRNDFFGDHPWELARPRIVAEDDGKDHQRCDWSKIRQPGRQLNGESVVQRQLWLMHHENLPKQDAYDKARKEFYEIRHREDIERRMAKEEALMTGAYFGKSPLEVGMQLEDQSFEKWKIWAKQRSAKLRAARGSTTVFQGSEDDDTSPDALQDDTEVDTVSAPS